MRRILQNRNFYVIFLFDLFAVTLSLYASYAIRFDFAVPADSMHRMLQALPMILVIKLSLFFFFHIYQGMWRASRQIAVEKYDVRQVNAVILNTMGL